MDSDDFPPMVDITVRDPVTGEPLRECTSVLVTKLEDTKLDLMDQYPGCEFDVYDHVPDTLDIPTFLRRT